MAHKFTTSYLEDSVSLFRYYKKLAEKAIEQVPDKQLFTVLDPEMNSIGLIVKHIAGNMRSRWTDFLISDGEKLDRNRDSEFEKPPSTREAMMKEWESGWNSVFCALRFEHFRPRPYGNYPWRTPFCNAGDQPSACPLSPPYRADCIFGEALSTFAMEISECASRSVRQIQ